MPFRHQARRVFLAPAVAVAVALALALTACSSSGPGSSSATSQAATPASTAASSAPAASTPATNGGGSVGNVTAITEIKANWVKFFSSSTPNSERVALLENGQSFTAAIKSFSASPLAAAVTSKVDSVKLSSATQAAVKYDLTAAGTSVASGQSGTAVLQSGVWKVGDDVFCGLLKQGATLMGITVPAACK
jgi:hypothetical protein